MEERWQLIWQKPETKSHVNGSVFLLSLYTEGCSKHHIFAVSTCFNHCFKTRTGGQTVLLSGSRFNRFNRLDR
ncbi:hypothetical protein Patl1_11370 [Pistacia atlantica]|uniref:Uncharacterized protein n=1 Tax=Pistacia atlantica TaxID=434234 RepID=A0ACC1A7D0_9ROSI|nr:hypothetical protein Patl1_11370 [Pistacia atlantica]